MVTLERLGRRALRISHGEVDILRYVFRPTDPPVESPRPYFHPLRTLKGRRVTRFRPADHVWHKGLAWSLPNVGPANFWGGVTYTRDRGYEQLPNNGSMRHRRFDRIAADPGSVTVAHRLDWVTEPGETWFAERRSFAVSVGDGVWTLVFDTAFDNVSGAPVVFGSPTTQGRDNAGYGGLFWRGRRGADGGHAYVPGRTGGDDLMGVRAPWLAFSDGRATLVFVDAPGNPDHPVRWFVRSTPYACLCPAPFFSREVTVAPGGSLAYRYAVVVADGDPGPDGAAALAEVALGRL